MSKRATPCRLAVLVPLASLAALGPAGAAPTTAGDDEYVHVVAAGDTLIALGRRYLADPTQWPQLQRVNRVREPRRLPIGLDLRIPLRLMRLEPVPAALLAASGGFSGTEPAAAGGRTLATDGELVTDGDGSVTLRLVDGTELRLRGSSRLRLQDSHRLSGTGQVRSGVRLEQGRAEVKAQPARAGQPGFRIQTPQGVLAVRGTEYRVTVDAARTVGEVLDGSVSMSGHGAVPGAAPVRGGFGAVIDAGGRVTAPRALLEAPSLAGLPARHERPLVQLQLQPQAALQGQAHGWRVQVARDGQFDELLADVRAAAPELRIAGLPDGRYRMRVRAIDAQGMEGRDASGWLELKARPEPPLLRTPPQAAVLRGSSVELTWTASREAARHHLQLARAGAAEPFAEPMVDLKDVQGQGYRVDDLPPGRYLWRVGALRADGDAGPMGDAQAFELRALPAPAAPPASRVDESGVRLSWPAAQAGQRFELQLARDDAFAYRVAETILEDTHFELPQPAPGRYFVRMRRHEADGYVGPWSQAQFFDVADCVRDASSGCVRTEGGLLQRP